MAMRRQTSPAIPSLSAVTRSPNLPVQHFLNLARYWAPKSPIVNRVLIFFSLCFDGEKAGELIPSLSSRAHMHNLKIPILAILVPQSSLKTILIILNKMFAT